METPTSVFARSPMPLYAQVAALLRRRIEAGEWSVGSQLPTLEALEQEYRVARVTVRQAVSLLEKEGLVWRRQGKGTFVVRAPEDQRWLHLATEWSSLVRVLDGTTPRLVNLESVARQAPLRKEDGIPDASYQHLKRVHCKGEQPYCVIDIYLASSIYRRAPQRFNSQMVLPILASMKGVTITQARQTLTIGHAEMAAAEFLQIPVNAPVAEVRRVLTDERGMVIYLAEVIYRGDFIRLEIDLLGKLPARARKGRSKGEKKDLQWAE